MTMSLFALAFAGVSLLGLHAANIAVHPHQIVTKAAPCLALLLGAAFYAWRREAKCFDLIMMAFWTILFGTLHLFPMFIAARSRVGLSDDVLARLDRLMGIEVPRVLEVMSQFPKLNLFLAYCYGSLIYLMTAAVIVLPLCGKMRAAKEFSIASVFSAAVSLPLFAAFQALGPWTHYGYVPLLDQSQYMRSFEGLRSSGPYLLDLSFADGLICFPSFHTILAFLSAAALYHVRFVRWPAVVLAGLIIISTVTTGTHYVIDVVAGIAVALLSILASKAYSRTEQVMEERSAGVSYSALAFLQRLGLRAEAPIVPSGMETTDGVRDTWHLYRIVPPGRQEGWPGGTIPDSPTPRRRESGDGRASRSAGYRSSDVS
jgi:membrane-associated phospholipid phosphatase